MKKKILALFLSLTLLIGIMPVGTFETSIYAAEDFMRIVHLDCGRKYFNADEIKGIIDFASENCYTHVELAFGNDGLRFIPDNMEVTVADTTYTSTQVTDAIKAGNDVYSSACDGELSESDFNTIIAYSKSKNIEIIPLLNMPGHMNALLYAGDTLLGKTLSYSGSSSTIDITDSTATGFVLSVLQKYVDYFAVNGCKYFNFGADEYANDIYGSYYGMGFGKLQDTGYYDEFAAFVNSAASIIKAAGMTPMAFNDGLYFENDTSVSFDSDIVVCYWSSGWSSYDTADASTINAQGHKIINTNDGWYYVLGRRNSSNSTYCLENAQSNTQSISCTEIPGDDSASITPIGAMLCVWCDDPSVEYSSVEASNVSGLISGFAASNPNYFEKKATTVTDTASGICATAVGLTDISVEVYNAVTNSDGSISKTYRILLNDGNYKESAAVKIPYSSDFDGCRFFSGTADGDLFNVSLNDGYFEATVPHFSDITITGADSVSVSLTVGETTEKIIVSANANVGTAGSFTTADGIAGYTVEHIAATEGSITPAVYEAAANVTCNNVIRSNGTQQKTDYYYKVGEVYYPVYATRQRNGNNRYNYTWYYSTDNGTTFTNIGTQTRVNSNASVSIDLYKKTSDEVVVPSAPASTTVTFYGVSPGTTTVEIGDTANTTVYKITVTESPIRGEFWCTSLQLSSNGKNYMELTAEQLSQGVYINTIVPEMFDAGSSTTRTDGYYYWKARVIDRAATAGGQLSGAGDNECVTESPAAYDVDALKYEDGSYWFRVAETGEWKELHWGGEHKNETSQTGHQLVFYYACRYINNDIADVFTSDWGEPNYSGVVNIYFKLYEVTGSDYDNAELLDEDWDGFANGIKVIVGVQDPSFEVVRSVVDYADSTEEDKIYPGQITDNPAVVAGKECTVKIYVRKKATFSVTYDWLNNPPGTTLPEGSTGVYANTEYTVDTDYASGTAVTVGAYEYTFSGWYLDSNLTRKAPEKLTINGDVTLYGQWTRTLNDAIIITANSNEKIYDKTALTDSGFTVKYHGVTVTPNSDGTYTVEGENLTIEATVEGSITDVGTVENKITDYSVTGNSDSYNVTTVNGFLKVTPKIYVQYNLISGETTVPIAKETYTSAENVCNVNDMITLDRTLLNKHKENAYLDGEQETVPYTVTYDNEQTITVNYTYALTSITITKKGYSGNETVDASQTFLFKITGNDGTDITITVHGDESVTVNGLTVGAEYTVTEITDWSWRYNLDTITTDIGTADVDNNSAYIIPTADPKSNTTVFTNKRVSPYWLDGYSWKNNIFEN